MTSVALLGLDDVRTRLRAYARSNEWWIIVSPTHASAWVPEDIERRYYCGRKNDDLELFMVGGVGIFAARKRRMTAAQLGAIVGQDAATLERQDILILANFAPESDLGLLIYYLLG